ncbi:PaaI family thioesterase [Eisenibacter elegans]|jgi:uncharacterized protein (TIGR00369 family)|uniref:PaaI family thioesterase n=1 Tax=Eisenibacter elegans TaxID=997 RepID=UPI0003F9EF30|nr:PaaI family thioesterase [Eisenibacter elegans]
MNTQENPRLAWAQSMLGQSTSQSPSPFGRWLNGTIVEASEACLVLDFIVRPEMTNPAGMLHGGVTAGMFDEVMGMHHFLLNLSQFYPTITLKIDYLGKALPGEVVRVRTELVKKGSTLLYFDGTMYNAEGKLLAKASTHMVVSRQSV